MLFNLELTWTRIWVNSEKSVNNGLGKCGLNRRWKKIDRKTAALTLLLIVACAAIMGELMITARAAVTKSANPITDTIVSDVCDNVNNLQVWSDMIASNSDVNGTNAVEGRIEVVYKANMTTVVSSGQATYNLSIQEYQTLTINPTVKNAFEGDRPLVAPTTTAKVTLQNSGLKASENLTNSLTTKTAIDKASN